MYCLPEKLKLLIDFYYKYHFSPPFLRRTYGFLRPLPLIYNDFWLVFCKTSAPPFGKMEVLYEAVKLDHDLALHFAGLLLFFDVTVMIVRSWMDSRIAWDAGNYATVFSLNRARFLSDPFYFACSYKNRYLWVIGYLLCVRTPLVSTCLYWIFVAFTSLFVGFIVRFVTLVGKQRVNKCLDDIRDHMWFIHMCCALACHTFISHQDWGMVVMSQISSLIFGYNEYMVCARDGVELFMPNHVRRGLIMLGFLNLALILIFIPLTFTASIVLRLEVLNFCYDFYQIQTSYMQHGFPWFSTPEEVPHIISYFDLVPREAFLFANHQHLVDITLSNVPLRNILRQTLDKMPAADVLDVLKEDMLSYTVLSHMIDDDIIDNGRFNMNVPDDLAVVGVE